MRGRTRALFLIPLLVGCGELLPQIEERGDCTLDRVTENVSGAEPVGQDAIALEAPYAVTLKRDELDGTPEANLVIEGDGWDPPADYTSEGKPTVRILKPDGDIVRTLSNRGREGPGGVSVEHTVHSPGVWTYIVEWELIDCLQIVAIEVRPPQ